MRVAAMTLGIVAGGLILAVTIVTLFTRPNAVLLFLITAVLAISGGLQTQRRAGWASMLFLISAGIAFIPVAALLQSPVASSSTDALTLLVFVLCIVLLIVAAILVLAAPAYKSHR